MHWAAMTTPSIQYNIMQVYGSRTSSRPVVLYSCKTWSNIVRVIKSRRIRCPGHVAKMEDGRSAFTIFTDKPTGKRPLGRPICRWNDNIRMKLKEISINIRN